MRIYISADNEGITGLISWAQCSRPNGNVYDFGFARRMMTHDVNAAIRGARAAGASEIVVKDSHGSSKNLLIDELEPGAQLISGFGSGFTDGMMLGVGEGEFHAAVLVGYHAMAGTARGIMEHTYTGGVHRIFLGGRETGEMGLSMGVAAQYGVPTVAVTSDAAGVAEAAGLIPGIATAQVKTGCGRFSGRLLHPSETAPLIETAVKHGIQARSKLPKVAYPTPLTLTIEFNRSEEADQCERFPGIRRKNGYTVEGDYGTFAEAHAAFTNLMSLSLYATEAQ
ncbi:MAG: M55 family metallopeptidase [Fimbriimonadaceae bacterium]